MKRAITLYIGESRADLADDGFVLFNYALANLTNPAVQRNSWSQGVTLPRTPANDAIFGDAFRLDRNAGAGGTGAAFSASRKTPFTIYADSGEILTAGYCKLTSVTRDGYEVQLFGGLGELVYNLSYDADGNKRTLASLDYGVDLDFVINAHAVKEAWAMLRYGASLTKTGRTAARFLQKDGTLTGNNASFWVDTFDVVAGSTYEVECQQTSNNAYANVVAYDSGGGVLGWFKISNTGGVVTMTITMPAATATIAVQGSVNITPSVTLQAPRWNVLNFAPCYNGIPGNAFSPDKALAIPSEVSIPDTKTGGYDAANTGGYTLVTFPEALDEWAVKDFRSYLQRPVLRVWKLLEALADPVNNGGWTIDLSDINNYISWPYYGAWLTRPLLPSLGTYKQEAGVASISGYSPWTTGSTLIEYTITGAPANASVTAKMTFKPTFDIDDAGGAASLKTFAALAGYRVEMVTFLQPIAYDANNLKLAAGKTTPLYKGANTYAASAIAQMCGYTPDALNGEYAPAVEETAYSLVSTDTYVRDAAVTIEVEATDIDHVEVVAKHYLLTLRADGVKLVALSGAALYDGIVPRTPDQQCASDHTGTATTNSGETLRSGARVTKEMLLTTGGTPAEYLLSLCKVFGLLLVADSATKTARLLKRESFYKNEVIDLSERIDRSREMELVPLSFDAKWYDWKLAGSGGAFEQEYKEAEGVEYGMQRVDTNYDFDANAKDILSGLALKSCAAVLDSSKYWCYADNGGDFSPAVFLYAGCMQTLWDGSGNGEDFPVPVAPSAGVVQYNPDYDFYDPAAFGRAEFRDKDNKGLDGADVLLDLAGFTTIDHATISDDISAMTALNGGTPCWLLSDGASVAVPDFCRVYYDSFADLIRATYDMGAPRQIAIPGMTYPAGKTIYAQAWRDYIRDRLSASGKVLRCRVRLDGLKVGTELLRKFYWYGGSLWVINSISNYSLTTFDPAEVELVQVRDKDAYLNGQY